MADIIITPDGDIIFPEGFTTRYEYHIVLRNGSVFTLTTDRDLFWEGWHALAAEHFPDWAFVSQWECATGTHTSTVFHR